MRALYVQKEEPMGVFVLFSGGASSLKAMLADPNYGSKYRVVGAYTDNAEAKGRSLCQQNGIEDLFLDRKEFYTSEGLNPKEWASRIMFYERLAREIERFNPDVIALSGYMHIVAEPLLEAYPDRILNVHPADLAIVETNDIKRIDLSEAPKKVVESIGEFRRKFTGDKAVYDAIAAGESFTRSTVHILNNVVDGGPIITRSKQFAIGDVAKAAFRDGADNWLRDYVSRLQEIMKDEGDGPAYVKAMELLSTGRISKYNDVVFLNGRPMFYGGCTL